MGIFPWKANGPPCQCLLPLHLRKGSSVLCLWAAWDYQEDTTLKIVTPLWMVGGINPVSHKEAWRSHTDAAWGFESVCLAQRGPCFCRPMTGLMAVFCWGWCCVGTVFPPSSWGMQTYLPLTNGEPFVLCGFNLSLICIAIKIYNAILESRRKLNCVARSFNLTCFTRSKLQGVCAEVLPSCLHLSFLSGSVFSLTQKPLETGEHFSVTKVLTVPKRKQTIQYMVYKMKGGKEHLR